MQETSSANNSGFSLSYLTAVQTWSIGLLWAYYQQHVSNLLYMFFQPFERFVSETIIILEQFTSKPVQSNICGTGAYIYHPSAALFDLPMLDAFAKLLEIPVKLLKPQCIPQSPCNRTKNISLNSWDVRRNLGWIEYGNWVRNMQLYAISNHKLYCIMREIMIIHATRCTKWHMLTSTVSCKRKNAQWMQCSCLSVV